MKKIKLKSGDFALVDDENYEELNKYKWYLSGYGYAIKVCNENGKTQSILMHKEVLNIGKGKVGDHINGNRLDNRKENLRIANNQKNAMNSRKTNNKTSSIYKGVCRNKKFNKWQSNIKMSL